MTDATALPSQPKPRRGWLRALLWIGVVFLVLVVIVYFVATSAAFLKGVILPKVSKSLNATVTVSDASISPFSQVVLKDLKVQTTGADPLLLAPEVRLRYSLFAILGGNLKVDLISLSSPTITLVNNPDNSSNLDPLTKGATKEEKAPQPAQPSKPLRLDINKIALTDGTVRQIKLYDATHKDVVEVSHLNVTLENLRNGGAGTAALAADLLMQKAPPAPAAPGLLNAKIAGKFDLALTQDLKPATVRGNTRFEVSRAEGLFAQAVTLAVSFDCDISPTEIKQVALRFLRGEAPIGELTVSGPFDMNKSEGRLLVKLQGIDKKLLNLAGAASGLDFGPTTISSTNTVELTKSGSVISAAGQLLITSFEVTRTNQTTPTLNLRLDYGASVDTKAGQTTLNSLVLNGTQKGQPLLQGELTQPMIFRSGSMSDSALSLSLNHLDLADWKPFLRDVAPAGDVNATLKLVSHQAQNQFDLDASSDINNLTVGAGTNQLSQLAIRTRLRGQATDLKQYSLSELNFVVSRQGQELVNVSGTGTCTPASQVANLEFNARLLLAGLLRALPRPDLNVSSGTVDLKAKVTQEKGSGQSITGNLALSDLTGSVGSNVFRSFGASLDLKALMAKPRFELQELVGKLSSAKQPGGACRLSANYDLETKAADFKATLEDLNQNGLRPFLESAMAGKELASIDLNGTASGAYVPNGASSLKTDLAITNFVVRDPKQQIPATPLQTRIQLDAGLDKNIADIRQALLALPATPLAPTNQVQLTGRIDMSQTNVIQGSLKLAADTLDLTTYYDIFMGEQAARTSPGAPAPSPAPAPTPAPAPKPGEPKTQVKNFTAEAAVHRLFLREVVIGDFQLVAKMDGGHVVVTPCKLALNGAPVSGSVDLDMDVPGFKYTTAANAQAIPLAPLVNSFQPERKGQIGGTLTADFNLTGAGASWPAMYTNLNGAFNVATTNLNLSVANVKSPLLKALINVVGIIPDLVKNPDSALSSLVGALAPKTGAGATGGLSSELSRSLIDQIILQGGLGSARLDLKKAFVQSPTFQANATGTVAFEPIMTNSAIQIPVAVSLRRDLAQRFDLVPANTPTNPAYVELPSFLTMRGTVGEPKTDINKLALAGSVLKSVGGLIPKGQGQTGSLLQNLGGLLEGKSPAAPTPAPGSTNAPAPKSGGFLQGLGGLLGQPAPAATNPPPTNAAPPAASNQTPVGNLLNELLKPKSK